jgi:phage terminase small subunit
MAKRLTDKQREFVKEYVLCLNATEAARRAGYAEKTARQMGSENLSKPDIRAEIDAQLKARTMSPDEVIARLSAQAESQFGEFITENWQGQLSLDLKRLKSAGLSHLIKKISNTKFGPAIEFHDPQAALSKLAQFYGLLNDGVTINVNIELVTKTVKALEDAGLDPSDVFNDLISEAASLKAAGAAGASEADRA